MELILEVMNSPAADQSFSTSHRFTRAGGSIGRGSSCAWQLPDSSRHLSSQHALILTENGQFYIEDLSTNGLFINGSEQALGKGNRHCVRDGDQFRFGPYEVAARLQADAQPVPELPESIASFFEELETSMPAAGHTELADQLVSRADEVEESSLEDLDSELEELAWALEAVEVPSLVPASGIQSQAAPSRGADRPTDDLAAGVEPGMETKKKAVNGRRKDTSFERREAASPAAEREAGSRELSVEAEAIAAFTRSAGLDLRKLPAEELVSIMDSCGSLMRSSLKGMMDLLAMRMEQKNRFRLGLTLIQRTENNPLKYSVNEVQALNQLVVDPQPECLSADESVRQAVSDLMQHLQAIETAYQELIREIVHFVAGDEATSEPAARRGWVDRRAQKRSLQKRLATLKDDQILQREFFEHRFSKLYQYAVTGVSAGVEERS